METLGHSDVGITLNTYSHVVPALQEEAAQAMDRSLAGDAKLDEAAGTETVWLSA